MGETGPAPLLGFGNKFDLVYCIGRTSEGDLNDSRPTGEMFDVLVCVAALRFHLPNKNSHRFT